MIKVLVSDMDGTLFEGHGETVFDLSQRNQEALEKLKQENIQFCVASGRMIGYGIRVLENAGFKPICAGFNGAVCYDQGKLVKVKALKRDLIQAIISMLNASFHVEFYQLQGLNSERIFFDLTHPIVEKYRKDIAKINIGQVMEYTITDYLDNNVDALIGKLSITMKDKEECLQVIKAIKALTKDACFVTMSNDTLIEVGNNEANKGVFIEYLQEAYGFRNDEIAVIGDAANDAAMFPLSMHRFAMACGNEGLKNMADDVVGDVAECIERCIQLNKETS